jgi:hypothetical protein
VRVQIRPAAGAYQWNAIGHRGGLRDTTATVDLRVCLLRFEIEVFEKIVKTLFLGTMRCYWCRRG